VFAAAFLIHDDDATKMVTSALRNYGNEETASAHATREISIAFQVSLEAAGVCFDQTVQKIKRQQSGKRIRKNADEAIASLRGKAISAQPTYLDHPCTNCHLFVLIPNRVTRDPSATFRPVCNARPGV
jgi:hypothetical protein